MYGGNVTFALGICRNCRVLLDKSVEMVSKEDSHDEYYETDIDNTRECLAQVSYVKKTEYILFLSLTPYSNMVGPSKMQWKSHP